MKELLRWMAPGLAVIAIFFLPALRASAPILPAAEWSVAELGGEAFHAAMPSAQPPQQPTLAGLLRQARSLRRQFGGGSERSNARVDGALALAVLIPAMAIVAGLCGLLSVVLVAWRRRWLVGAAVVGCGATAYAVGASWWLTRVARAALAQGLDAAQRHLGGRLLGGLDWKSLQTGLLGSVSLAPEAGLYLLFLAFLAMLVVPATGVAAVPTEE